MDRPHPFSAAMSSLDERLQAVGRVILGIAGPPGVGKSTVAQRLVAEVADAALFPLDGFHLAGTTLERLGLADRKGAPETFDGAGFVATLERVVRGEDVYVPGFDRNLEEPIAGAILVPGDAQLVVVEGNYLLVASEPWGSAARLFDQTWYLEVDDTIRRERLVARHMRFGRTRAEAQAWVAEVDDPNAALIGATRARADVVVIP